MDHNLHLILLPPAGSGSKGDEAMLRGALSIFQGAQIVILNPQERTWKEELLDIADTFTEQPYSHESLTTLVESGYDLIVIGADAVDGSVGLESSMLLLDAMEITARAGGFATAFFSFRSDPDGEIVEKLKSISLHPKIYFHPRDFDSERRFRTIIGSFKGGYFPDFSFYCPKIASCQTDSLILEPISDSDFTDGFIALNYSEQSFRATRTDYTDENRGQYISAIATPILSSYPKLPIILIANDVRGWFNFSSDYEYACLAKEKIKKLSPETKVFIADPAASYAELISLLEKARFVVTGRMHLSIAAFRAGTLPIAVTGQSYNSPLDEKNRGMLDKAQGMFDRCIGCRDLVITSPSRLSELLPMAAERYNQLKAQLASRDLINGKEEAASRQNICRLLTDQARSLLPDRGFHIIDIPEAKWVRRGKIRLESKIGCLEKALHRANKWAVDLDTTLQAKNARIIDLQAEVEKLSAWGTASNRKLQELSQELEYLRKSTKMQLSDWNGWLHKSMLIADWLVEGIFKNKVHQRFGGVVWRLNHPTGLLSHSRCNVHINGRLSDSDGRQARQIFARLGNRVIPGKVISPSEPDSHFFDIRFSTKPGLKFISLFAELENGLKIPLGYRLLYCSHKGPPPRLTQNKITPSPKPPLLSPSDISLKSTQTPLVSIIIPVYNQTNYTLQCLKSIGENSGNVPYEVIIIDDCSSESEIALLNGVEHLCVRRNSINQGFILNCNDGAKMARGKYLIFLNNDTQVQPCWLQALLDVFTHKPDAGLVGAKLVYPDGRLQEAGGIVWKDGSAWNYGHGKNPSAPEFNYIKEADYCSGACLMIKTDLFLSLGGFDIRYIPAYYEDTDLAFRVREIGLKVYYQPRCEVIHHEGQSNGTDPNGTGLKRYQIVNHDKFITRWRTVLTRDHLLMGERVFQARERSLGRPCLLVIDHYVPRFDRDAGSKNIFHYISFFCEAGFSVKFMPDNLQREEPYVGALEKLGVEVLDEPLEVWLSENGLHLDYILLSRAHIAVKHLDTLKKHTRARLLFYGHDLLSRTHLRTFEVTADPAALVESQRWTNWENEVFARVDAVFYPSVDEIRSLARTHPGLNAQTLPLFIYPPRLEPAPTSETLAQRHGVLFVGGFGHPPNIDAVLWFCGEVLPIIRQGLPDLRVIIAGSDPPASILSLASPTITVTGFISDEHLAALYTEVRLVIVPLRLGGGIKGKIIEALWHRAPVVTTPVGAEGIPDAETALVVAPLESYAVTLESAYRDCDRLANLAAKGAALIAQHYSAEALRNALAKEIPSLRQ